MTAETIRQDFPFFGTENAPIYLDNAATTQKPMAMLNRIQAFYTGENANIHRGGYPLAQSATRSYEQARATVAGWIDTAPEQVAFTQNATDALNQACAALAQARLRAGGNVVTTLLEHHSSVLPWMAACRERGAQLRILPSDADGIPMLDALDSLVDEHTAAVAITAGANSTGWKLPLARVLPYLRDRHIPVVLDATQRVAHERFSMREYPCDFLCFSGHKLYGPLGVGVLAMSEEWSRQGLGRLGGGMVAEVTPAGFTRIAGIQGWEAGTPPVAQAIGLAASLQYLESLPLEAVWQRESELAQSLREQLARISGIRVLPAGEAPLPIVAFTSAFLHATDMEHLLSLRGFALRCGQHCAHMAHTRLGLSATLRASLGLYTLPAEVDALAQAVNDIHTQWRRRHG